VTERGSNNEDLRLAAIVENSDDAIIGEDLEGWITSWNVGAERIFGYTAEEAVGRTINMIMPHDAFEEMSRNLEIIREGGRLDHLETTRIRKDGRRIVVSMTLSAVRDRSGKIIGASKIARDITAQKEAEQALRESEERFRATFELAGVGIAHVSLDGRWLRVNQSLCNIVGYSREELANLDFAAITHPDDLDADWQNVKDLLAGKMDKYSMEKRYIRKDGSIAWVNLTTSLVRDSFGVPKYFISIVEDTSERKSSEHALARQADMLNQAQEPIFAWELGGGILYWNRAAEELYGYSREEALGRRSHELLRTRHSKPVEEFERQVAVHGSWSGELVHTTKDGRVITVESRHKAVHEEGRVLVLESNRDITQRKLFEQQLSEINSSLEKHVEERTAQLNEANRELEAFAYSVSHDLRAPLRSIDGFGQILLREYAGKVIDETGERYIHKMSAAATRMANLIQDLLNLSRISRAELRRQRVNMSEIARSVIGDLRAQSPGRHVEVAVEDNLMVNADPRLLRVALDNLLGNAWKFTGKKEHPRIAFGCIEDGGNRQFVVRDNGAGFSMEYAANLFGPFQRVHHDSEFEGTGIGLAIVQRVIHKHGGTIWAEAQAGKGASFFFTLG